VEGRTITRTDGIVSVSESECCGTWMSVRE
jgi:hypothetical protein